MFLVFWVVASIRSITEANDLSHNPSISSWNWELKIGVYIKCIFFFWQESEMSSITLYPGTLLQKQIAVVSAFSGSRNDKEY